MDLTGGEGLRPSPPHPVVHEGLRPSNSPGWETNQTNQANGTKLTKPTKPTKPTEPTEPTEPIQPTKLGK